MKPLVIASGANGHPTFSIPTPDSVNGVVLAADTAESITVPADAKFGIFSATADFYASYTGTAVVITDTTDGTGHELNPVARSLGAGDTISVISGEACNITVSFYK